MSSRIGGLSSELPHITTTMTMQQYCLRWNNHQPNFISVFSSLLNSESLVDVTLAAEGRHLQAHKVVLSACSSYFQTLLTINPCQHPIVILKDVKFADLKVMVDFMYYGEVNVSQEQLPHILKTAEMLKIKGLAEIPVDQSISKSQCNPGDRAELLTSADAAWSAEIPRQSLSPSPCPLSPGSKRKRLRKSSTGSGSGSMERVSEEHHQSGEITLTSSAGGATSAVGTVIKSDSGNNYPPESNSSVLHKTKQHCSSDTEQQRGPSHESVEADVSHQVTLQVPPEINVQQQHNLETTSSIEIAGPSTSSSQMTMSEKSNQDHHLSQKGPLVMGTKRGRFLMRQPRIKRECDAQIESEAPLSPQYLSVPPVTRQCSEPLPCLSPPPGNLLTVPGAILMKQHSHPLLPSQTKTQYSSPLRLHIVPPSHSQSADTAERAISPVVIVTDPLAISPHEGPFKSDGAAVAPTSSSYRMRNEELKRSASSPQSGTRSSHCPVVRPGPALGCNYCWNTVDTHGRILRRKTKYHCPECQTNLCIVPCFQEYHERHQTDPLALTTSVMRVFPKTTSM